MSRRDPGVVVAAGVHRLATRRLARAFVPLALATVAGLGEVVARGDIASGGTLAAASLVTAVALAASAMGAVRRTLDDRSRTWVGVAALAGLLAYPFGIWVLAWRGLRGLTAAGGGGTLEAVAWTLLGGWVLLSAVRVQQLHGVAEAMRVPAPEEGGTASG